MSTITSQSKPSADQRRARHAWDSIQEILRKYPPQQKHGKSLPHEKAKKVGGQAKKLPMRILASGLGQALVFLRAKDYAPEVLVALGDWVLDKRPHADSKKPPPDDKGQRLIEEIVKGSSDFLRRATDETLAYLQWFNRFAEAEGLMEGDE